MKWNLPKLLSDFVPRSLETSKGQRKSNAAAVLNIGFGVGGEAMVGCVPIPSSLVSKGPVASSFTVEIFTLFPCRSISTHYLPITHTVKLCSASSNSFVTTIARLNHHLDGRCSNLCSTSTLLRFYRCVSYDPGL